MTLPTCYRCGRQPCECPDGITLYHADCRDVLPLLPKVGLVLADPPYGIGWKTPAGKNRAAVKYVTGDDKPFDPSEIVRLGVPSILWGGNHFADKLPASAAWLVWDKRPTEWSNTQADCEMAWTNLPGPARMFRKSWGGGGTLAKENGPNMRPLHPNQKPIALMRWCMERAGAAALGLILDPYVGSGTTLRAAKDLGRKAIGIEIEEKYCKIAAERLRQEILPLGGPDEPSIPGQDAVSAVDAR